MSASSNPANPSRRGPARRPTWGGLATWLSPFIAGLAVYFAYSQAEEIRNQTAVTRDTEHRQLRAYVGLIPLDGTPENIGRFAIKNYGSTPARNIQVFGDTRVLQGPLPEPKLLELVDGANSKSPFSQVVFPQDQVPFEFGPDSKIETIKVQWGGNATMGLYTFGKISYDDVFGKEHKTSFCIFYNHNQTRANRCVVGTIRNQIK